MRTASTSQLTILKKHNVDPGSSDDINLTLLQFELLLAEVKTTLGEDAMTFVQDAFMPNGEPMAPGYEDSLSHYMFVAEWEEICKEL